jgi:tetratricopeptide (TPR) repeat protein
LYYANVFKYNNQFEKFNLSNLPRSRFISEILTAVLKDLQTLPPSDLKELGEYTSTIEVSMSLKDYTKFALASSTTFALMKLAAGASPIEAGQPVKATNIPTEIQFADRQAADGHFVEAKKIYEGILKKSPTCVAAINNLGLLYNGLGHHEQAIPLFDKIIHELDPELPQAYLNKGISLANLDKRNEAVENYKKAIQKNPENSKAWYQKGIVYFESGKYSSAKDCFERVLHVFPSVTHFHLSKCLVKLDDQQGAMFNVNEAIKSDSTNIDARFWKMDLLHKSGNREGALTQLSEIADICYELMTFHRTNKKTFDDAINYYFTAADLKAMTLIEMGRYEACNKFLDELLFQIPEHAMGWYNKACALAHLKRKSEMLESLRKGIDRMPSLKEKAQEDKDFQDYWRDEEFNTVVGDSDPLLSLAGTLESDITNIGEKHDFYIGQTILTKLRGEE